MRRTFLLFAIVAAGVSMLGGFLLMRGLALRNEPPSKPLRVHFHGDSITHWGSQSALDFAGSYPHGVAVLEPSWKVTAGGMPGEPTRASAARLKEWLATHDCPSDRRCVIVLLAGTNDPLPQFEGCDASPDETVDRLFAMAETAKTEGWTPVVSTLTPAPDRFARIQGRRRSVCPPGLWNDWVERVNARIREREAAPRIYVADLGGQFTLAEWLKTNPDVHPRNEETRAAMAAFFAENLEAILD